MWFTGLGGTVSNRPYQIGYAFSNDGKNWTKYSNNPVIKYPTGLYRGKTNLKIFTKGNHYLGYFTYGISGIDPEIHHATSKDGISWTEYANNPVLKKGPSGAWDDSYTGISDIISKDINSALDLLNNPLRIIATLRS